MIQGTLQVLQRRASCARRLVLLLLAVSLAPTPGRADPDYGAGPVLYGLDPVIRATNDPRLLGVDRLVLRARLADLGVDPYRRPGVRPGLETSFYKIMVEKSRVDLERREYLVEYNGALGLMTEFRYPTYFYLFPSSEPLPGGFTYYPPRPVGDPVVEVFVDDVEAGARRRHAVGQITTRTNKLDVAAAGKTGKDEDGLINLTIPIKLPRTLEKIIGRGEKTRIKITGREHISITGESTVVDPFIPNERVQSQSLFPTLDMEQELQVSLSGTIGEKIIIEVDHNSTAIGPDATKIRLMYQGDEDEIIKTIETGDVGLTLPGSQLLGYNSNKSGLFGVKVTGQVGRADFTVVASKQNAESSAKTFNAKGGQVTDHVILSSNYLNNRFFKLDLPASEPSGRRGSERIDRESIKIYRAMGAGPLGVNDIQNVAVYVDSVGFRDWEQIQFATDAWTVGQRWRELTDFDVLLNADGGLEAVDMRSSQPDADILAVVYSVVDDDGNEYVVGDDPARVPAATQPIDGQDGLYYRMKLLKTPLNNTDPHVFEYVLRNIYSLGGANIDASTFDLRIETTDNNVDIKDLDNGVHPYVRIFGLDTRDQAGNPGADGLIDLNDPLLFDLQRGLLKFPLDFPQPFAADPAVYEANYNTNLAGGEQPFVFAESHMADKELLTPEIYSREFANDYQNRGKFNIIATHASASSSFNLGASNIEEESEVVTLDGRTLTRGVDYDIDYTFGELVLKGEAANLTPDSKIAVTYSFSPFFGGGDTSLMGLNLGYDLGRESKFATTWLYESKAIVGEKAKLGEEPSRNLVGNVNLQHTFRPTFLTDVANAVSRRNTERESTLQFNGEMAVSLPNPNTKGRVFLEDFEGVDSSDQISLNRIGWFWASQPYLGASAVDTRVFAPTARVDHVRWFLPKERTLRRYLNPDLINQERDETQPTMDLYLRSDDGWSPESWGGIMRGISRTGIDLSKSQFIEIWINDMTPEPLLRSGTVHLDFGYINEDGFWPERGDSLVIGRRELEDVNQDGVWVYDEDIGLDGLGETGPQRFDAAYEVNGDAPYPFINGTARNNREDDEDINGNGTFDRADGYFTATIDLAETEALVDVVQDYDDVQDLVAGNIAWRKYRIPIAAVDSVTAGIAPNIKAITHVRIWFEDDSRPVGDDVVHLQLSEFRFLGSRWEREGIRRIDGERLLSQGERLPGEEFFLGEVNNKENPDYRPPFQVEEVNNIPEKEQSLVLNFQNIEQGHMTRASKQVSSQGDDYTTYRDISWYWFNDDHANADLDLFFRVGSDTLNYYEVVHRYADMPYKTGWTQVTLNIAELSNAKNGEPDAEGALRATVGDVRSGNTYDVKVVGRPDLRRVRRYYFGVANRSQSTPASGVIYLNDVRLEGVKRDMGMAQRVGLRLNMADVFKTDFDWRRTDAEYRGLDRDTGSGINNEDWTLNSNFAIDDFVPLLGFKLPVNLSRRRLTQRPKYETNSDIEILDEDVRNNESTFETTERFSTRLSHNPSKAAVLRYVVDPWVLSLNGSRTRRDSPLERTRNKNLSGSVNYDLRIAGIYRLGRFPGLSYVPVLRGLSFIPRKVAFGASFTSSENNAVNISTDGVETPRASTKTRPATFTASVDYQPLTIVDLSAGMRSERDLLRPEDALGVNVGTENRRSYDLRMTFVAPKISDLPDGAFFAPIRTAARGLIAVRPSIQFTGSFADVHDPAIRQPGDPDDIRSVSNAGKWDFRLDLPLGDGFKKLFPERRYSEAERERLVRQQRALEEQRARLRRGGQINPELDEEGNQQPSSTPVPEDEENLTPEERQRREQERLLQAAEEQRERDREQGLIAETEPEVEAGGGVNPLAIFDPFLSTLRNLTPLKATYSRDRSSSYARLLQMADFWYKTGLVNNLDVARDQYASFAFDERDNFSLATSSQITRSLSLDAKYANSTGERNQIGSVSKNYKQDWPDVQISLTGLERWGVFGADPNDRESGWFRTSNINFSYKQSKAVTNYTATSYNPRYTTTISPRWTLTFHSGLSATLNATLTNDESRNNGVITNATKSRYGVNVRHQFRADSFLAKLGLYRPGSSQAVNMDIDVSYQNDRSERLNPNGQAAAPTGTTRYSLNPRFSVQVTRALNTALRFIFSRSKNIASNQTTTNLGLGVEATFVF